MANVTPVNTWPVNEVDHSGDHAVVPVTDVYDSDGHTAKTVDVTGKKKPNKP